MPPASCAGPSKTPVRRGVRGFDKATHTNDKSTIAASNAAPAISAARAFHELSDQRTKRLLVHLAERIVKRQVNRRGDAG
jgi:hypothetical protein